MTVIGSSLLSARYYKLVVYTNTFKSATASTEYVLVASCPPSAGTCVVTPTSGMSGTKPTRLPPSLKSVSALHCKVSFYTVIPASFAVYLVMNLTVKESLQDA